jgi:acyl carrier protein|tara:strand:+ start:156 stop:383 length:228 start_codon:yes stop_codon:yes gene_type:complete
MTKDNFLVLLAEVLQRDEPLNSEMDLEEIQEYDSMSQINIIVLIDTEFGELVSTEDIDECVTVQDIINLVKSNID